nr:zinc carboxypeptidase-like [Onthophagus taurus]XP_022920403.1 zinc carboxypeptidase-like [Onthophagus taurus]
MKELLFLILFVPGFLAEPVRYDGFKVFKIIPQSEQQVDTLRLLEETLPSFNFWRSPAAVNRSVEIMVPPFLKYDFEDFLNTNKIDAEEYIEDVQKLIDNEKPKVQPRAFGWTSYYRTNDIYNWMDDMARRFPSWVRVVVGGRSHENREIRGLHISFSRNNENNAVFLEGGIHAREWISPAVVTFIINELLTSTDSTVRAMAERYDWYIFPIFNPDGYEWSHTRNRMWRKTRVPYGICTGADPNRNWDYRWNTGGASNFPCMDTFAGPRPFSEPETKSMSEYIKSINSKLIAYITFHSFTQLLLYPYGHTRENLDNAAELQAVGEAAARSLARRYGTQFRVGNVAATIYIATGGSMDWVKGVFRTRITYTYELRDTGRHGFLLPADQIIPSGEETMDSLVTIMDEFNRL